MLSNTAPIVDKDLPCLFTEDTMFASFTRAYNENRLFLDAISLSSVNDSIMLFADKFNTIQLTLYIYFT